MPGGDTNQSIIGWLPKRRMAIVENIFGHVVNVVTIRGDGYRKSKTSATALESVRTLEPTILDIEYHEPVMATARIAAELVRLHASVTYVHHETVRHMNDGKDVYTTMAEIRLPPELQLGEGFGKVS